MTKHTSLSRRHLLKGAGAAGATTITGFPAISYAQAEAIKIGCGRASRHQHDP